jgi:hypothetical protein
MPRGVYQRKPKKKMGIPLEAVPDRPPTKGRRKTSPLSRVVIFDFGNFKVRIE